MGGQQLLSLQPPDDKGPKCLAGPGKPMHEILHALGVFHEQSRADRDDHVLFIPENVIKRKSSVFSIPCSYTAFLTKLYF